MTSFITDYIPQRAPMIMVDDLQEAGEEHAVSLFRIQPTNILVADGHFTAAGLIENIAQTAAAMVGYQCHLKEQAVPLGYIAALKNLKIHSLPASGKIIRTSVEITNQVMDITIIEGMVTCDEMILCSCEMRILIKG